MINTSSPPSVQDFDALLEEMKAMNDRTKPVLELQFAAALRDLGYPESLDRTLWTGKRSALYEMIDRASDLIDAVIDIQDLDIQQRVAKMRARRQTLQIRAMILEMWESDDENDDNGPAQAPTNPKPSGMTNQKPVAAV